MTVSLTEGKKKTLFDTAQLVLNNTELIKIRQFDGSEMHEQFWGDTLSCVQCGHMGNLGLG